MRFITTLILVFILLGVVVLVYFHQDEATGPIEGSTPLFPGLVASSVDRIELSMYVGRKIVMESGAGGVWKVTEPYNDLARSEMVRQILDGLIANERVAIPLSPDEMDLPAKGLDPPKYHIAFHDAQGDHLLLIGSRDPFQNEIFVMIEGDENLYRTGANLLNIVELNPENLRDDRVFRIDPLLVNAVKIEGPGSLVIDAKKSSGIWEIMAPHRVDGNSGAIQNLVARLTSLRISSRLHEGRIDESLLRACGLDGPVYKITLSAGPVSRRLTLEPMGVGPAGDYLGMRENEEAVVGLPQSEISEIISRPFNSYRSRELLKPVRETLHTLKIWHGEELYLELVRMSDRKYFKITSPFKAPADNLSDGNTTPIYNFLTLIDGLRIHDFVADGVTDLSPYGLDRPAMAVELYFRTGGQPRKARLVFGNVTDKEKVFTARVDRHGPWSVFLVNDDDLEPLRRDPLLLRDRRIFPQDIGAIQAATFRNGERRFTIDREEGGFFSHDPDSRFQQFLNRMKDELVVRYEADPDLADSPLYHDPACGIDLTMDEKGTERAVRIVFGAEVPDGVYGKISDQPRGVFLLEKAFLTDFKKLFLGL